VLMQGLSSLADGGHLGRQRKSGRHHEAGDRPKMGN
jgi:hypothetical protein